MAKRIWIVIALILVLGSVGAIVYYKLQEQKQYDEPVIHVSDEEIVYDYSTKDESVLMQGVTAEDKQDGDLTSAVFIDRIIYDNDKENATVYYSVFDKDKCSGSASRNVKVVNYNDETPRSELERNAQKYDIQKHIDESFSPAVTLKTDYVTLNVGEKYDLLNYIDGVWANNNKAQLKYHSVPSYINIKKPGKYIIQYYVETQDGLWSDIVSMTLEYVDPTTQTEATETTVDETTVDQTEETSVPEN